MGVPFLGRIPLDPRISRMGDEGTPPVTIMEDFPAARGLPTPRAGHRGGISVQQFQATERAMRKCSDGHARGARKPPWFKVKLNTSESYVGIKKLVRTEGLHTVCEEARCPNLHECWGTHGTASFMILGDICTRRCRFCAVGTGSSRRRGRPGAPAAWPPPS